MIHKYFVAINRGFTFWSLWFAIICCIGLAILPSCRKGTEIPDVTGIDGSFPFTRFEQLLFAVDTMQPEEELSMLRDSFPELWSIYFRFVLPLQDDGADTTAFEAVSDMLRSPRMRWLYDTVQQVYPAMPDIQTAFESAFQYYLHHFPERLTPHIYTLVSDFSYFPFIFPDQHGRDGIGISLEMFLGADFPYRQYTGNHPVFSAYLVRSYNRDHIVKKTLEVLADDMLGPADNARLLDYMIRNGKKLYILKQLLPNVEDTVILEYTPDQLQWCRDNERNIWAHFLTEDLLYSMDFTKFQKLVQHSPGSPGMPPEAPGRTANWIGYRIISALMNRHKSISLKELIEMRDAQEVLDMSKYKPL